MPPAVEAAASGKQSVLRLIPKREDDGAPVIGLPPSRLPQLCWLRPLLDRVLPQLDWLRPLLEMVLPQLDRVPPLLARLVA